MAIAVVKARKLCTSPEQRIRRAWTPHDEYRELALRRARRDRKR